MQNSSAYIPTSRESIAKTFLELFLERDDGGHADCSADPFLYGFGQQFSKRQPGVRQLIRYAVVVVDEDLHIGEFMEQVPELLPGVELRERVAAYCSAIGVAVDERLVVVLQVLAAQDSATQLNAVTQMHRIAVVHHGESFPAGLEDSLDLADGFFCPGHVHQATPRAYVIKCSVGEGELLCISLHHICREVVQLQALLGQLHCFWSQIDCRHIGAHANELLGEHSGSASDIQHLLSFESLHIDVAREEGVSTRLHKGDPL